MDDIVGMGLKKDKQKEPKGFEKGFRIKAMQIWAFRNGPRVIATLKKKKKKQTKANDPFLAYRKRD